MASMAQTICSTPDRMPKERRDWAEFVSDKSEWNGDVEVCHFRDGSTLMMLFDENLSPIELLVVESPEREDAVEHARQCVRRMDGWDVETLSHNIESNYPDLGQQDCDEIATLVLVN